MPEKLKVSVSLWRPLSTSSKSHTGTAPFIYFLFCSYASLLSWFSNSLQYSTAQNQPKHSSCFFWMLQEQFKSATASTHFPLSVPTIIKVKCVSAGATCSPLQHPYDTCKRKLLLYVELAISNCEMGLLQNLPFVDKVVKLSHTVHNNKFTIAPCFLYSCISKYEWDHWLGFLFPSI